MADQRIKGQEVSVFIVQNSTPLSTVRDIQSFDMEPSIEVLTENYLGETTSRKDEIYNGYSGNISLHFGSPDVLDFIQNVIDRARRREPGLVINIQATLNFPSGVRRTILMRDCFFSAPPISFGDRASYGTITVPFEGSDFTILR